jgi:DNA-binding HxlR family transcriptional regulator
VADRDRTNAEIANGYCPYFQHVVEVLGRRWTGVILRRLLDGPARFSDLKRSIPGITDRLLSTRLGELELDQLVGRDADESIGYRLTERGEDLRDTLNAMGAHAEKWAQACHLAAMPGRRP